MTKKKDEFQGIIKTTYAESTPWWKEESKPPAGAPNILYIVLDDTGYSQLGCYGSLIETPNIDSIAADGLRYTDFHVNAMCSPTRASLLTGCNNHTVGLGYLSNFDLGFPPLSGNIDPKYGYISETLLEHGYSTFMVGKWHLCNAKHMNGSGPFHQWPLGRGFEKYYGFLNAATSQFYPDLVCDNHPIDPPKTPEEGYHLSADLVDKAIEYIGDQKSCFPEKPFFCDLSFGAMHAPHHAPKEYIAKYKGRFDEGWDVYRKKVFEKQKKLGIIPENTVLTEHNYLADPWDSLTEKQKKIFPRFMEVFAGYLTYTDAQLGRLLDFLKKIGQYDNTLIVLISDNGASGEGGPEGCFSENYHLMSMRWADIVSEEEYKLLGSPEAHNHYPRGWGWAGNTPLKMYKTWVHAGGVKVPLIISYPNKIKDKGSIRTQYHHVVDINKTVLDICGINQPDTIKGVKQAEKPSIGMTYTFNDPKAPRQRHVQYYEMLGNRGIWADGWKAVADHVISDSFEEDKWELYHTDEDHSEAHDLAEKHPEKLRELVDLWWHEAGKFGVLPMLESYYKKKGGFDFNKQMRFAPSEYHSRYTFYPQMTPNSLGPRLANKSFVITIYLNHKKGFDGTLLAAGDNTGGYTLYIKNNKLVLDFNYLAEKHYRVESEATVPDGDITLGFEFVLTRPNEGVGRLLINGKPSGVVTIKEYPLFSGGKFAIGRYGHSPIAKETYSKDYYRYKGVIDRVEIDMERPVNDMDLMLELEKEHDIQ
ncbi:MAG: arylsulfatase [Dehalococcoidales bacterium]|nr:arylsulfatase [Dehalococcoidales bacterium]